MKKYNQLLEAIESGEMVTARELAMELYNHVRDFSQSIAVSQNENGQLEVRNHQYASPEYVAEVKGKIQQWVGGH